MTKNIFLILLLFIATITCNRNDEEQIEPQFYQVEKTEKDLLIACNSFGFDTFNQISSTTTSNDNLIFSPINTSLGIHTLLNAANGKTQTALKKVLGLNFIKNEKISSGFDKLNSIISNIDEKTKIEGENLISISENIQIKKNFQQFIDKNSYPKFHNNLSGKEISNNQNNSFKLTNTFSIEASIANQKYIEKVPFYNNPNQSNFVDMLVTKSNYNYYSDIAVQAVELPIGRGNFNLLILVPKGSNTTTELAKKLDSRLLNRILSKCKKKDIEVFLPLIDITHNQSFNNLLKNKVNQRKADYSNMSESKDLYLSGFEQITSFNLSNAGLASSSTNFPITNESFLIDHPFIFVVYEKYSNATILVGMINNLGIQAD